MPDAPPATAAGVRPVEPRHAASLIVLRERASGREVLMGLRGARHRFMPNHLVFPGGAVDPEDSAAPAGTEVRPEVMRLLRIAADPSLARALAIAATRELEEETGLSLGTPPLLDGLDYLCRAVTPEASPMRFDARFLVVDAARVSGRLAGSGELEGLRWYGLDEVRGLDLAFVTRNVLARLGDWLEMGPEQRHARTAAPLLFEMAWRME